MVTKKKTLVSAEQELIYAVRMCRGSTGVKTEMRFGQKLDTCTDIPRNQQAEGALVAAELNLTQKSGFEYFVSFFLCTP